MYAQGIDANVQPAEFPPESFERRQYVDSEGCVFIRAGIDGNTSWVPRVARNREQVCGFQPTFRTAVAQTRPAPQTEEVEQITLNAPKSPAPRAAAPAPARTSAPRVSRPAATPKAQPRTVQVQPRKVPASTPALAPKRVVVNRGGAAACQGVSSISQQYLRSRSGMPVRCGPQTSGYPPSGAKMVRVDQNTRIAPLATYQPPAPRGAEVKVPHGYRPAWTDDRLNPRRAEQSLGGIARMELVWTNTVPRRLVNRLTGEDVTAQFPHIPYAGESRTGATRVYVVNAPETRATGKPVSVAPLETRKTTYNPVTKRQTVVSTRSAPRTPKAAQPTGTVRGHVQLGVYGSAAEAQQVAQRARSMGLPVRIGKYTRGGQTQRLVLVGPYGSQGQLNAALSKARQAGFRNALIRN